jgi:hypothetical protein
VYLLDKPSRRKVQMVPDYNGLTIPDKFIVGYGLDYAEKYRNLPRSAYSNQRSIEKRSGDMDRELLVVLDFGGQNIS